jgi:hypothetical protein
MHLVVIPPPPKDGGKIFYTCLYFRNLKFLEASASGPIPRLPHSDPLSIFFLFADSICFHQINVIITNLKFPFFSQQVLTTITLYLE